MAKLPSYSPYFKYRGAHDIYDLGVYVHHYKWSGGTGQTTYRGFFINSFNSTNGATGKIIKGDFAIYGQYGSGPDAVRSYAQQAAWDISVKLWCHDIRDNQWHDLSSALRITPNNTKIKIKTYWGSEPYQNGIAIYGYGTFNKDDGFVPHSIASGLGASATIKQLKDDGYYGYPGYDGHSFFYPELVGYRYHSNNGNWAPDSIHITPFYKSGMVNHNNYKYTASGSSKSKLDGGGGDELEYRFILNENNGVGLDYFQLEFIVDDWGHWYYPTSRGFWDYNKIDNPMLSVPDFGRESTVNTINWPPRFDAMSYYYDGNGGRNGWHDKIPLFRFYNGSSWVCF